MTAYSRVTISLPTKLLKAVDEKLSEPDETRSAVIRRLVVDALRDIEEREQVEQFIKAYTECPETEEEFGWAEHMSLEWAKDHPY